MDFWIKAAQLILSLSILIVLHEFGHFIPARIFKTRVEKFYLFFDYKFSLLKKKIGETTWGIGWIPLGGYVKIAGMIDESMDTEQMSKPAEPWEFRSKPAWQRLIIMIGGVVVNVIVGVLIYIFVFYTWGEDQIKSTDLKAGMTVHPYMEKYGIQSGDNILEIDGMAVMNYNDINAGLLLRGQRNLKVQHTDGKIETITLPEDIDYKLFTEGAFPTVGLRHKSTTIQHISTVYEDALIGIKKQDVILEIDGKPTNDLEISELRKKQEYLVKVLRGKEEIELPMAGNETTALLNAAPSLKAGFQEGDKLLTIADKKIEFFDDIVGSLYHNKGKKVTANVLRDKDTVQLTVQVSMLGSIGFAPVGETPIDIESVKNIHYSFSESIGKGAHKGYQTLSDYASQMKFLFTKKGVGSMGGFGALGNMFPSAWNWEIFWMNTALISIILAFMNILPIPALDGGHVVFLLYEMITGKEAPQKVLEYAQYIGFFLILALVIYANGNDLFKWFTGG